ncbi:hypothetical protein [Nocardiopsis halotolerans]|uniref:hypothetical protein n=1 Tax=Nocardiopsis halotolerans TaxID=124252 RepID=UPI00034B8DE2|nr:hypothetical protein [Nocardiopsis halotolerans]
MRTLMLAGLSLLAALTTLFTLTPVSPAVAEDRRHNERASILALRVDTDHIYVSPWHQDALDGEEGRALHSRLKDMETPVYVVLVRQERDLDHYVEDLAHSLGGTGYYFAVGGDGRTVHGAQFGMDDTVVDGMNTAQLAAEVVNGDNGLADAPITERLNRVVDLVEDGDAALAYRIAPVTPAAASVLASALAAVLLGAAAWWWLRRRQHRPIRVAPLTEAVTTTVSRAQRDEYRAQLAERLTGCGQRVSGAGESSEKVRQALEAYTAAAKVLDSAADKSDLVGVQVLLDMCDAALNDEVSPLHCFFDPRHDSGKAPVRWRAPASFDSVRVMACRECRKTVRKYRTPPSVLDSTGARPLPYYTVPPEHSVWAATGYGTLTSDLPARIMRGEHRR